MKFCYLDESGTGQEPIAVMAGVVTDATRMRVTKHQWFSLLDTLSEIIGRNIQEIHTRDFYSGNSPFELQLGFIEPSYEDEIAKVAAWTDQIFSQSIPKSGIYLSKGRCEASELFCKYAPECVL